MQQTDRKHGAARLSEIRAQYEQNFLVRDGTFSIEPLEYHLYHLALYWSRLMGFCRLTPTDAAHWVAGSLGACVAVGTEFVSKEIDAYHPFNMQWLSYSGLTHAMLNDETTSFDAVKSASDAFAYFLDLLGYVPWEQWTPTPTNPVSRLPRR